MRIGDEIDGAAFAAVAAVGSAAGDELLASEAERTGAAVTGGDVDVDFVNEHGCGAEGIGGQGSGIRVTVQGSRVLSNHRTVEPLNP
jgi:hypothetical protein